MDGLKARLSFDAVAYDYDDEYLTIDTDTHTININNVSRLFGVQYDGNSKLIKFRIRNKLSDIQKMQDSIVYINWIDSKGVKGQSIAINKTINNDTCEFAWKVPFDALKNSGILHFAMSAVMTKNSSSVIDQRWSTQIASVITPDGIYIKSYTPSSEEEDRIAQIYNELSKMINTQSDNLQSQVNSLKVDFSEQLGEVKKREFLMPNSYGVGAIEGNVGEKITIGTQDYWTYSVFDVIQNEKYKFITNTTSNATLAYVFFTTSDGTIVKKELGGDSTDDWIHIHSTIVPKGATKMYIQAFANMNNVHNLKCWKSEYVDIQTQIDAINAGNPIPSYYKEHIASKIEMINANSSIKNGMTFAFITDTHVQSNSMNSKYLLKEIFDKTKTPFVIFGGDVLRAFGTKDDLDADIQAWSEYVAYLEDKIYQVRGNHDFTIKKSSSENEGYTYSDDKVYSEMYKEKELSVHGLADSMCFYIDNPMQKIHIICMNEWEDVTSGEVPFGVAMRVSQNQLDWLIDILKIDGYTNIIVTHHTISPNLPDSGGMLHIQGICEALNNRSTFSFDNWGVTVNVDFTNATSFVAFNLCGHSHRDASGTTNNVLSIETTCDAHYQDDGYDAVVGTVTEQAFDVFTINTKNRTIKAVRVGRGNDREWNY